MRSCPSICLPVRAAVAVSTLFGLALATACHVATPTILVPPQSPPQEFAPEPQERHFGRLLRLTNGGENAEAYFSFDGRKLSFQSSRPPFKCDQIFTMNTDGTNARLVSTGQGRTTCSYFMPGDRRLLYASTHLADAACPPPPDYSHGYVWAIYPGYDIFTANADGTRVARLTNTPGYDAEATVSPQGDRIVFTSMRDGDLDLYSMKLDGSDVRRLTSELGYDGGAFYSPDGTKIIYRSHHPTEPEAIAEYKRLLGLGLVRPSQLEIWVMNADGSGKRQVTSLKAGSFAPYLYPSGQRVIFSSNYGDPKGREFDLYAIDLDGQNLEKITDSPEFDGFPMFSPDGTKLAFCSNRHNTHPHETNVYMAEWR